MIRVGINGFGRMGRLFLRRALEEKAGFKVVAVNTSGRMEIAGWAQLFEYDTVYHRYAGEMKTDDKAMIIDGQKIAVLAERNPQQIPWGDYGVELVVEATGAFRKESELRWHLRDTVKRVLLTAPAKEGQVPMYLLGINDDHLGEAEIWSNASCTTNCVAPVTQVIQRSFKILKSMMTTVHAVTSDQRLLDNSHKDLRRARAGAWNIVPTSTGAAQATGAVIPEVKGIFTGLCMRVPVPTGSVCDFTFLVKRKTTKSEVNKAFVEASKSPGYLGILTVSQAPLVSSDVIGSSASAIVDLSLTQVVVDDLVKVIAWYDNEWGYVCRLVDQIELVAKKLKQE
ncbi:type I glyceraldehyde-3-phosphate dehydrogenase [Patescibacteria group bacterium]|nr:type I glyceraldehyde-3-phosphate dehydrogenase [Patescibacteria group bacterium]MBU1931549.1 type I glyceraldehyde-3-phosphate dehydrogenase [Patescibacteria group bacterium]